MSDWEKLIALIRSGQMPREVVEQMMNDSHFKAYYIQRCTADGRFTPGRIGGLPPRAAGR